MLFLVSPFHLDFVGMAVDLYDKMANIASKEGAHFEAREEIIEANTLELKHSVEERFAKLH